MLTRVATDVCHPILETPTFELTIVAMQLYGFCADRKVGFQPAGGGIHRILTKCNLGCIAIMAVQWVRTEHSDPIVWICGQYLPRHSHAPDPVQLYVRRHRQTHVVVFKFEIR